MSCSPTHWSNPACTLDVKSVSQAEVGIASAPVEMVKKGRAHNMPFAYLAQVELFELNQYLPMFVAPEE
jgi:hypothetical protein